MIPMTFKIFCMCFLVAYVNCRCWDPAESDQKLSCLSGQALTNIKWSDGAGGGCQKFEIDCANATIGCQEDCFWGQDCTDYDWRSMKYIRGIRIQYGYRASDIRATFLCCRMNEKLISGSSWCRTKSVDFNGRDWRNWKKGIVKNINKDEQNLVFHASVCEDAQKFDIPTCTRVTTPPPTTPPPTTPTPAPTTPTTTPTTTPKTTPTPTPAPAKDPCPSPQIPLCCGHYDESQCNFNGYYASVYIKGTYGFYIANYTARSCTKNIFLGYAGSTPYPWTSSASDSVYCYPS